MDGLGKRVSGQGPSLSWMHLFRHCEPGCQHRLKSYLFPWPTKSRSRCAASPFTGMFIGRLPGTAVEEGNRRVVQQLAEIRLR